MSKPRVTRFISSGTTRPRTSATAADTGERGLWLDKGLNTIHCDNSVVQGWPGVWNAMRCVQDGTSTNV